MGTATDGKDEARIENFRARRPYSYPIAVKPLRRILQLVAVGFFGYLLIALGQTLVLEVLLRGRTAPDSPWYILAVAGLGTVATGLLGGFIAARLGGDQPLRHAAAVLAFLGLDSVYVVVNNVGGHPLWYELGGAATLLLATAAGGWLVRARNGDPASRSAPARDADQTTLPSNPLEPLP